MKFDKLLLGYFNFETVNETEDTPVVVIPNIWNTVISSFRSLYNQNGSIGHYYVLKQEISKLLTSRNVNAVWLTDHMYTDVNPSDNRGLKHSWMEFPPTNPRSVTIQYARWEDEPENYFNLLDILNDIFYIFKEYTFRFDIYGNRTDSLDKAYVTVHYKLELYPDATDFKYIFGWRHFASKLQLEGSVVSQNYPSISIEPFLSTHQSDLFIDIGYNPSEIEETYNYRATYPEVSSLIVAEVSKQFVQR